MARIRSMKPELRTDLVVAAWPIPARYAWTLLWGYLDDSGRGVDDDRLLVADLFPLDRDVTEKKFSGWKKLWVDGGQVCRYTVDGTNYLHAVKWDDHQRINRPTRSRIPPCPTHSPSRNDSLTDSVSPSVSRSMNSSVNGSRSLHGKRSDGSLPRAQAGAPAEQGSKGAREQGSRERVAADAASGLPAAHAHPAAVALIAETGPTVPAVHARLVAQVDELLGAGTDVDAIRRGLVEWRTRPRAAAGLLPHLVQDQLDAGQRIDPRFAGLAEDARRHA